MTFCQTNDCPHYGNATKYPRKCYYEPQCWKGYFDQIIHMCWAGLRFEGGKEREGVNEDEDQKSYDNKEPR